LNLFVALLKLSLRTVTIFMNRNLGNYQSTMWWSENLYNWVQTFIHIYKYTFPISQMCLQPESKNKVIQWKIGGQYPANDKM